MNRIVLVPVILAIAGVLALAESARAQGDPLALQQSAIQRIDGFVEHFRKTGDMETRRPDLERAAGQGIWQRDETRLVEKFLCRLQPRRILGGDLPELLRLQSRQQLEPRSHRHA